MKLSGRHAEEIILTVIIIALIIYWAVAMLRLGHSGP